MNEESRIADSSAGKLPSLAWWTFRQRGILANLPLVFALFWTGGETNRPALTWPLGIAILMLGVAVRVWAQAHIQHHFAPPMKFTATGPYQMVRNPLYIGNTLIIVGATVCSKLLWLVPISLAWCAIVYSVVVRHEESQLPGVFGDDYREFVATVPRWVPRWSAWRHPKFINRYSGKALVAELHCFLVLVPFIFKDFLVSAVWQPLWNKLAAQL